MRGAILLAAAMLLACSSGAAPGAACNVDSDCTGGHVCFGVGTSGDPRQCMASCDPTTTAICSQGAAEGYNPVCLERALVGGGVCYTGGTSSGSCTDTRECRVGNTCITDRGQCLTACDRANPSGSCVGDQVCMPVAGSSIRGYCAITGADGGDSDAGM